MTDQEVVTWSHGGLSPVRACPACRGSERVTTPYRTRDYLGSEALDEWLLWRCAECASIFLDPRPDDASIPMTYQSYYTHIAPSSESRPGLLQRLGWGVFNGYLKERFDWDRAPRFRIGNWLCSALPPLALKLDYFGRHLFSAKFPNKGLLVDIGCGNGDFLGQALQMGWQAHGIEPDPAAVEACRAQGFSVFAGSADSLPSSLLGMIDVVTLSHCIEHVADPRDLLAKAQAMLKPGGWIWLATPNPQGLGIKLFGNAWRGLEPSRHLCIPSQGQLAKMLAEQGFDEIRLVRRGAHGKTITRESAQIARLASGRGERIGALCRWLALPTRLAASIGGSVSPRWGEETVIVARRKDSISAGI